jgi:hypothetical protein
MTKFGASLFHAGFAIGAMYYDDHCLGDDRQNRLVLSIAPERRTFAEVEMIVDSGSPWCLLSPELYQAWGLEAETEHESKHALWIRGTRWLGQLTRTNLILKADDGESLIVTATFFIPAIQSFEIWNYPNFLGLDGFLNRIRYAVDPSENVFYFGPM